MSRPRSAETELRELKREQKAMTDRLREAIKARDLYRARVAQVEQELAEWKKRFDQLLGVRSAEKEE